MIFHRKHEMVDADNALPGRTDQMMVVPEHHFVNNNPQSGPWPEGYEIAWFAIRMPKTAYLVAKVKLTLDLAAVTGWKQIDAVQLVGAAD